MPLFSCRTIQEIKYQIGTQRNVTTPAQPILPDEEKSDPRLFRKVGERTRVAFAKPNRIKINVTSENLVEVAKFVRDELKFDQLYKCNRY